MTKNLPHQEIGHDDVFIKYIKKIVILIKKYPYHSAIVVIAAVSLIVLLSNLFGRRGDTMKTQDHILLTMNNFDALYYGENTQEVLTALTQSMDRLSKISNQDTTSKGLITTLEGYSFALQLQYQMAAEKWQKVFGGEVNSSKTVALVATLGFTDMVDPINSVSIIFPRLQEFFVEDSGLAMLALLDAGENAVFALMYDTSAAVDTSTVQLYDMGKMALDFSVHNMTNLSLKNEALFYREMIDVAYQVRNNKIETE